MKFFADSKVPDTHCSFSTTLLRSLQQHRLGIVYVHVLQFGTCAQSKISQKSMSTENTFCNSI